MDVERGKSAAGMAGRKIAPVPLVLDEFGHGYSVGTTISFGRTMLSRLRAADSITRGSFRSWSTSSRNAWLLLRRLSTSVLILACC